MAYDIKKFINAHRKPYMVAFATTEEEAVAWLKNAGEVISLEEDEDHPGCWDALIKTGAGIVQYAAEPQKGTAMKL